MIPDSIRKKDGKMALFTAYLTHKDDYQSDQASLNSAGAMWATRSCSPLRSANYSNASYTPYTRYMPRIARLDALETVSHARVGGLRRRSKVKISGTNTEPLGVRKIDILPPPEESKSEEEAHARFVAGRKAEWKRRQDVSSVLHVSNGL
jgi:hypothetical protein